VSLFVANPYAPTRRLTREVRVGDVGIGGSNPIRVQSMTTVDTRDTQGSADEVERLVAVGCEIVRITAPSKTDAENLAEIRKELDRRAIQVPLVADIHFTPNAAMIAAEHVEKIRINPGNFADKKKFAVLEYTDQEYSEEVERVAERFRPLIVRCRELGRAIRIGTNHGSLSDRIMNRFGDTSLGMVESALEFLDACEAESFFDVVFSMKSSNTQVAIQAYRLLAARLDERAAGAPSYPLHVGITEAGDGEDGRIKSAIGIGALLADGIGDTIRVSLTEPPEEEVPVAAALATVCSQFWGRAAEPVDPGALFVPDPYAHERRATRAMGPSGTEIGGEHPVRVELDLGPVPEDPKREAEQLVSRLAGLRDLQCEGLTVQIFDSTGLEAAATFAAALKDGGLELPFVLRFEPDEEVEWPSFISRLVVGAGALIGESWLKSEAQRAVQAGIPIEWDLRGQVESLPALVDRVLEISGQAGLEEMMISVDAEDSIHANRVAAARLMARRVQHIPIILRHRKSDGDSDETALLRAAHELGAPLCDGIGDAISLAGFDDPATAVDIGYRILQGARCRTSRTEFISCPSCGRTLFDLVETTERIKARTDHLVGVKIAIMGCIVNGPGEMADADFGYVGSGPGSVNLFVGKDLVVRNVPTAQADDRLVELIQEHGRWVDR